MAASDVNSQNYFVAKPAPTCTRQMSAVFACKPMLPRMASIVYVTDHSPLSP